MGRRKQAPQVARPAGLRRAIELGKDLLIVALTCSALLLALQTPMGTQLRGWVEPPAASVQPVIQQPQEAVTPYVVAVRNSLGLYGASYDQAAVERVFDAFSSLLGEGLSTAGTAESITPRQWQTLLEAPGLYCAFQGAPPLAVLSACIGGGGGPEGAARALLLSWDGTQVWLAWRDGESYYRARTQVAYKERLESALGGFTPNGAAFAYALARSDSAYATLDPYVLVSLTPPQPQAFTAAAPDFVGDGEALEQLLTALGFQSGVGTAYEAGGDVAINESGDRLRVSSAGGVTFHAGEDVRYPVACEGPLPTGEEAMLCAWELLNRAAAPWKGETAFVLAGVEATANGWVVTFRSCLRGVPVRTGADGWCASFTVEGQQVSDFTLTLRTYTAAGDVSLVPPARLAAAALASLPGSGGRLVLCYSDMGGGGLSAGWMCLE